MACRRTARVGCAGLCVKGRRKSVNTPSGSTAACINDKHGSRRIIISEKQAARPVGDLAQHRGRVVFVELPTWQLLILAGGVGVVWAASLFDWSFVIGRHAFWQFPQGTIGGSQSDMATELVGYLYYVQSPWRLPLFYVSALGAPDGMNVIFTSSVPIVALIGKVVHSVTGATINLYGGFLFLCFALPGVMMTLVLIAAKVRYPLATVVAAIFANSMPALLWRWGHIELEAHFLLTGALALYLFSVKKRSWRGLAVTWMVYLTLTFLTANYLFAMVGIVWLCAAIQRRLDGLATTREALGTGALTVALVTSVIVLSGQLSVGNGLPFSSGYGHFSMNLLSPVVPQNSGLFPWLGGVIDADFQYEGFNYLGMGLLLASLLVLPAEVSWLRRNLRQHVLLLVAFAALTAFAISHRVFAGHWLLFELPLPRFVVWALGIYRSSGRFFWLIPYAQLAVVIVLGFRRASPAMVLCLVAAAILQLLDVQPLREQIIASIAAGPGAAELDRGEVAHLVAWARYVEVVPSFQWDLSRDQQQERRVERANMDLLLATASANVPTNTVYSGRKSLVSRSWTCCARRGVPRRCGRRGSARRLLQATGRASPQRPTSGRRHRAALRPAPNRGDGAGRHLLAPLLGTLLRKVPAVRFSVLPRRVGKSRF